MPRSLPHAPHPHCLPPAEAELVALRALRSAVLEELPADSRGHFSVTEADLEAWAAEAAGAGGTANGTGAAANAGVEGSVAARSCISFETVGEALEEDADWEASLSKGDRASRFLTA